MEYRLVSALCTSLPHVAPQKRFNCRPFTARCIYLQPSCQVKTLIPNPPTWSGLDVELTNWPRRSRNQLCGSDGTAGSGRA